MNRLRTPRLRRGYTLLEVLLALGLSSLLMLIVYGAMESFWRLSTLGRLDTERSQLARTLIRRIEMDVRSVVYQAPKEAEAADTQAADEGGANTATVAGESTADAEATSFRIQEDEDLSTAGIHLVGTSQSLSMITLKPSRNRTGSLEESILLERESDRRKITWAFFPGGSAEGSGAGLSYRNVDQRQEELSEEQGLSLDSTGQFELLAPEVANLRFQYLDGTNNTWMDQWNSRDLAGLPRAIKVTIQFHSAAVSSSNRLRTAGTSASTETFQTVVHLPLSEAPPAL